MIIKTKYAVLSGFLGSGKTTAMIALAKEVSRRGLRGAVLVDDLGAKNIVDAEYTTASGVMSLDISGDCICYQHENLVDKLNQLKAGGAEVIFSDIPGCGIGALDHVYLEFKAKEPDMLDLMPFTCIVDPERLRMLMDEGDDLGLPQEMRFLLDAQMREADLILLNKTDLISEEEKEKKLAFIRGRYPETAVMAMSAITGEGVPEAAEYLLTHHAPAEHKEIGYGSEAFMAAENLLCWYNRRVFLEEKEDRAVDFNAVFTDLMEGIRGGLLSIGGNVPHLKLFAAGTEEDFFKASLIDVAYDIEYASTLQGKYSAISLVINARAAADSQAMTVIAEDALFAACDKYHLKARTYFMESFGMTDEGRNNGGRASRFRCC